jgi:hypothetical protein
MASYRLKNKLPTNVKFYLSKYLGSKKTRLAATELREKVYDLV